MPKSLLVSADGQQQNIGGWVIILYRDNRSAAEQQPDFRLVVVYGREWCDGRSRVCRKLAGLRAHNMNQSGNYLVAALFPPLKQKPAARRVPHHERQQQSDEFWVTALWCILNNDVAEQFFFFFFHLTRVPLGLPPPAKHIAGDGYSCVNLWSEEKVFAPATVLFNTALRRRVQLHLALTNVRSLFLYPGKVYSSIILRAAKQVNDWTVDKSQIFAGHVRTQTSV